MPQMHASDGWHPGLAAAWVGMSINMLKLIFPRIIVAKTVSIGVLSSLKDPV